MNFIRRFAYGLLLVISSLNVTPSPARAQELACGRFTLTHEVHWQNAVVPAGAYRFSYAPEGAAAKLMLSRLDGSDGYLLIVPATEDIKSSEANRLVLEATSGGVYVRAMQLAEFGMTLRFHVPRETEKQIATTGTTAAASAQ